VSISIDASGATFQLYKNGIINSCGTSLNHAVLVVGYGHDDALGQDYWTVKNSWGVGWGEQGYFRLHRDQNTVGTGTCGMNIRPVYPSMD